MGDFETSFPYVKNTGHAHVVFAGPPLAGPAHVVAAADETKSAFKTLKLMCRDARGAGEGFTLEENGFELMTGFPRPLTKAEYYENQNDREKMAAHNRQCEEIVAKAFGEAGKRCVVKVVHSLVRTDDSQKTKRGGTPAAAPHCDFQPSSARDLYQQFIVAPGGVTSNVNIEGMSKGRFAIVNCWRNIADTPIQQHPLAVCDGRSVVVPDDYVPVQAYVTTTAGATPADVPVSRTYMMDPAYAQRRHKWYYYSEMRNDEVLVFMQHDSHPDTRTRCCFHTAVTDPRPERENAPFRESCETRCVVYFPDYEPDSLPDCGANAADRVPAAVQGIMMAMQYAPMWPVVARVGFAAGIYYGNVEKTLRRFLNSSMNHGDSFGWSKLSEAEREEVVTVLLADGKLTSAVRKYFKRPTTMLWELLTSSNGLWWLSLTALAGVALRKELPRLRIGGGGEL